MSDKSMTKEEIWASIVGSSGIGWTEFDMAAMDEYAKQESIEFLLWFVGQLKFPPNPLSYNEDSNEGILINLPTTIHNRYRKYLELKKK